LALIIQTIATNVSVVVSEPKTKEELKNVTIWNKAVKKLLGVS
jgi:hypothetical protein